MYRKMFCELTYSSLIDPNPMTQLLIARKKKKGQEKNLLII